MTAVLSDRGRTADIRLRRWFLAHPPPWNLTPGGRECREADVIVVSIPKSGRTWVRFLLASYQAMVSGEPFRLDSPGASVAYTHDLWDFFTADRLVSSLRGRFLIPPRRRRQGRILLIARDIRDVAVSLHFELTKRERRFSGTISELVRHPVFGVESMVAIMNRWMEEWGGRDDSLVVRYEDLRLAPEQCFKNILRFAFPYHALNETALAQSLEDSSFESMQMAETAGSFSETIMRPGNPADPESFKVRKGRVGGYRDYLTPQDIEWIEAQMSTLDSRYGYGC